MARKHFPTLNEYAAWVAKQPAGTVLGTAFNGMQYPYENYLSQYYGTPVVVIAGDYYEMNNRRYDLPTEWEGFTVGYHDSDLFESYEAAGRPQSGLEITTEAEASYLQEMIGVPMPAHEEQASTPREFNAVTTMTETINAAAIYRLTDLQSGKFAGWLVKSNHTNDYYQVHCYKINKEIIWTCTCKAGQHGFKGCKRGHCCHVAAVIEVEEAKAEARRQAKAEAAAAVAEAERQLAAERRAARHTSSRPRRKVSPVPQPEPGGGNDGKEVSVVNEPFPGRRTTGRKRAKAFAGFERDLAPLGPQGFSFLR